MTAAINQPQAIGPKVCVTCGQPGPGVEFCYEAGGPCHCNCWQNGDPCCRCGDDSDGEDGEAVRNAEERSDVLTGLVLVAHREAPDA